MAISDTTMAWDIMWYLVDKYQHFEESLLPQF